MNLSARTPASTRVVLRCVLAADLLVAVGMVFLIARLVEPWVILAGLALAMLAVVVCTSPAEYRRSQREAEQWRHDWRKVGRS